MLGVRLFRDERGIAETPMLNDAAIIANVRERASKILRDKHGGQKENQASRFVVSELI
jgi:hypothetical protein